MKRAKRFLVFTAAITMLLLVAWWANRPSRGPDRLSGPAPESQTPPKARRASNRPPIPEPVLSLNPAVFDEFHRWSEQWMAATGEDRAALAKTGEPLLAQRRVQLAKLIETDPERALKKAAPEELRHQLPANLQRLLESRISGRGDLAVFGALGREGEVPGIPPISRVATLGDRSYRAFVFGRRLRQPSLRGIALNGIAVDSVAALSDRPVRVLEGPELAGVLQEAVDPICGISGKTAVAAAETADGVQFFCGSSHLHDAEGQWIASENEQIGASSTRTEGVKSIVFMRVDFSDAPGEPVSDSQLAALLQDLKIYYADSSYGKTGFKDFGAGSAFTATLRMPKALAFYSTDPNGAGTLRTDARQAASNAGVTLSNFNLDVTCIGNVNAFPWAGLAYIGAPGAWIQGEFTLRVGGHELGHNYGLNHAQYWKTPVPSAIGSGEIEDYGDIYDVMSAYGDLRKQFNVIYKYWLDWVPATNVTTVRESGVYTIAAHDRPIAAAPVALRFPRTFGTNYWVEARQKIQENGWSMNGVGIRWELPDVRMSTLIDTTPGSVNGKNDAPLVVGRTFSDFFADLHITTLSRRGSDGELFDILVNRGPFEGNISPTVIIPSGDLVAATGTPLNLQASGFDENQDPLVYSWDFSDGTFSTGTSASKAWTQPGEYVVRCVASDMKGGYGSDSIVVRIGNPAGIRVSGLVQSEGWPVEGARVYVESGPNNVYRMCETDSTGSYYLTGLPAGDYKLAIYKEGYSLVGTSFGSPVNISANRSDLNFSLKEESLIQQVLVVPMGSEWAYYDQGPQAATNWMASDFDDSSWKRGAGRLGFGNDGESTTTASTVGPAPNITTYFRGRFQMSKLPAFTQFTVHAQVDDGMILYLNGREVARFNMPDGSVNPTTFATADVGENDEQDLHDFVLSKSLFVEGANVFAAEIHQSSAISSDLGFDLQLDGLRPLVRRRATLGFVSRGSDGFVFYPASVSGWTLFQNSTLAPNNWTPVSGVAPLFNRFKGVPSTAAARGFFQLKKN